MAKITTGRALAQERGRIRVKIRRMLATPFHQREPAAHSFGNELIDWTLEMDERYNKRKGGLGK